MPRLIGWSRAQRVLHLMLSGGDYVNSPLTAVMVRCNECRSVLTNPPVPATKVGGRARNPTSGQKLGGRAAEEHGMECR